MSRENTLRLLHGISRPISYPALILPKGLDKPKVLGMSMRNHRCWHGSIPRAEDPNKAANETVNGDNENTIESIPVRTVLCHPEDEACYAEVNGGESIINQWKN